MLVPEGEGAYRRFALRQFTIAIHRKPHTVLRRFAVQPRTVFSGAPCLKLSVDGYTQGLSLGYFKFIPLQIGCTFAADTGMRT